MASKTTAATLRKAQTKAKNEEKQDRLELVLLKAQMIKGGGKDPNFSKLAEEFKVSHSTLGHHLSTTIEVLSISISSCLIILQH